MEKINGAELELVFFPGYVSWLCVSGETIKQSNNYRLATETIVKMQELSEAAGARFLLVYVPTKEHIYLPLLNDAETLEIIFADVPKLEMDADGNIQVTNQKATPELFWQHMNDQEQLLAEFAAGKNIDYLNLASEFREVASTGAELYYSFDTHWNQSGNDLAAQTIANYVLSHSTRETGY
jgi:hypothetical protein